MANLSFKKKLHFPKIVANFQLENDSLYYNKYFSFGMLALGLLTWIVIFWSKIVFFIPIAISLLLTSILTAQSLITIRWMINIWTNPYKLKDYYPSKSWLKPKLSFTAIVPARHENEVIQQTLNSICQIDYPNYLKEIIVVCSKDDMQTIASVIQAKRKLSKYNINLLIYSSKPINKPHALNIALKKAKNQIVTIFDAEDEPSKDIYKIINTVMQNQEVDVVQSGVQLTNLSSQWFSLPNVLEYYFWFKSALSFFYHNCVTPLGGNTIFVKKGLLKKVKGWDQNKLTEDADLGLKFSLQNVKSVAIYNPQHVTREETPVNEDSFIKQRTRWHHGFLQILMEGKWKNLQTTKQKLLAFYMLCSPLIQSLWLICIPLSIWLKQFDLPILISMLSFLPLNLFIIQVWIYLLGLSEFLRDYSIKPSWKMFAKLVIIILPYQIMLALSTIRALYKYASNQNSWEKTLHLNQHRQPSYSYS